MRMVKGLLRASVSLILFTGAAAAHAQTGGSDRRQGTAGAEPADAVADQDGDIVVTGTYARSLRAATETKRRADHGVDSISSTDIGGGFNWSSQRAILELRGV